MKAIFLDFDGVLNGIHSPDGVVIDNAKLELVKHIVDATDSKIVLSTSWKEHWEKNDVGCDESGKMINEIFAAKGLEIYDKTPTYRSDRKREITEWLEKHPSVCNFAVIDDSPFEEDALKNHFVLTSRLRGGIDEDDMNKAISILNGN